MKNKFLHKFEASKKKLDKMAIAGATALATLSPTKVFAGTWGYSGMNTDSVMSGVSGTVTGAAQILGGIWIIVAIFALVMAIRNEDNEGKNKASLNIVAGVALLGFGTILGLFMPK